MDMSQRASWMKRGRGMRQEYSTKWGRRQEGLQGQGLFPNRFLGEWDYILGLAAERCRGADAPLAHAGVFGKGKRVSPGRGEIRG